MGLSFLVSAETRNLEVRVRWGDYEKAEVAGDDGKPISVWQRKPREKTVIVNLGRAGDDPVVRDVPDSGGLQLSVVERAITAEELRDRIPSGTRSPIC